LIADPKLVSRVASPDENAAGLVQGALDPLRYDGHILDPDEVSGIATSMIPRGAKVLEVGCGTGSLSQIVRETCRADVVGIEPDPARAQRAADRGLKVHSGFLSRELIQEIGPFDVVLFADVLEHLPNPQAMLLLSREALSAGGAVIVSIPNVAHWSVRANLLRGKFQYQPSGIMDATHLKWFTVATAESLIVSSGFKVIEYRASAGVGICDNSRPPLSWLPANCQARFLRLACRHWPTLFGCQHVLKAEKL
jgi:methionine biosynthesis protein MetW